MAGKAKKKLDYAGWSVDIFDNDTKIDRLLDARGWVGFSVYFYLCQRAFGSEGYFYKWGFGDSASTARKMSCGVNSGTVMETVGFCLQIDLFNQRLFEEWNVLTSRGIQRSSWAAAKSRRDKAVYKELWLLDESESGGVVFVPLNNDMSATNGHPQATNGDMPTTNAPVVKESKVKESKAKESKAKESKKTAAKTQHQTATAMIESRCFPPLLEEAVKDWVAYKIEKRQGYHETGLKNLLSQIEDKASRFGDAAVEGAIRESMGNNWQGIVWEKLEKQRERGNRSAGKGVGGYDWENV